MQLRFGARRAPRAARRLAAVSVAAVLAVALVAPAGVGANRGGSPGADSVAPAGVGTGAGAGTIAGVRAPATPVSPLRTLPTSLLVTLRPGSDPAATDAAAAALGLARVAWNPDARTAQYVAVAGGAGATGDGAGATGDGAGAPGDGAASTAAPTAAVLRAAGSVDGRERARLASLGAELRRFAAVERAAVPVPFETAEDPTADPTAGPPPPADPTPGPSPTVDPTPTPDPTEPPPPPPPPVAAPNDTYWSRQWGPEAIDARGGWAITRGRPEIVVAVLDTGVDLAHPDLKGRLIPGTDLGSGDATPADPIGHGTHVAGIVAATAGNAAGVAGTAPRVVVMPVKVMNDSGQIWDVTVAEAITWAVARGARVVNLSLGGTRASLPVNAAIDSARAKGVVVVAAAGNSIAGGPVSQPAAHPPAIAVAALRDLGTAHGDPGTPARYARAAFSNYGPEVDLAAPGESILSTWRGGGYLTVSGTSMATPFVAGVAALLLSRDPSLTPDEVEAALVSTAIDLGPAGFDDETGWGLVRAGAAAWSIEPPASDGAAPAMRISGITDGTLVRGTKTLTFTATDPAPIVALRLYRDGTYDRVRRMASYSMTWSTRGSTNGIHRWQVNGTDAGLNSGSALARVLVANDRTTSALRASLTMTSTRRSLTRTITLGRTTPLVARFTAPAGTAVRLRLVSSSGTVLADVRGTGVAAIALSSVRYGRYSLRGWAAVATPGHAMSLRADWFR